MKNIDLYPIGRVLSADNELEGCPNKGRKMRGKRFVIFWVVAFFLCVTVSIGMASPVDRITIADSFGSWNAPAPYFNKRGPGIVYTSLVFDTLLWKDRAGKLIPSLAEFWEFDSQLNRYRFNLNRDATWHDGKPVTAEDVVFTIEYVRKHMYPFVDISVISEVQKTGQYTFEIQLKEEFVPFLDEIAGNLPILPAHIYKYIDKPRKYTGPEASIGSGPFRLVTYDDAKYECLLEAANDYYGGTAITKQIAIVKMPPPVAMKQLIKGNISMMRMVPYPFLNELKKNNISTVSTYSGHPVRLLFNHKKGLFSDKRLRYAVAYAIDRAKLVAIGLNGGGMVENTGGISFASHWHSTGHPEYLQDYARTENLLNECGYIRNAAGQFEKDGKVLTIKLLTDKRLVGISKIISRQLENTGISLKLRVLNRAALDANLDKFAFDMSLFMSTALGDPLTFERRVQGQAANSDRFDGNEELSKLFRENLKVRDPEKRKAMVHRMQEIYAEELPSYYLYQEIWSAGYNSDVEPYYTTGGLLHGIPLPLNKLMFLEPKG